MPRHNTTPTETKKYLALSLCVSYEDGLNANALGLPVLVEQLWGDGSRGEDEIVSVLRENLSGLSRHGARIRIKKIASNVKITNKDGLFGCSVLTPVMRATPVGPVPTTRESCCICLLGFGPNGICSSCASRSGFSICSACGEAVPERNFRNSARRVCSSCMEASRVSCSRCFAPVAQWDIVVDGLCSHCATCSFRNGSPVNRFNYQPENTVFFSSAGTSTNEYQHKDRIRGFSRHIKNARKLYFGLELEVYCPSDSLGVLQQIGIPNWLYIKHDGSIGGQGFEMVTFPMTYKHWQEVAAPWLKEAASKMMKRSCTSFDAGTCGVHIHMSKAAFSSLHLFKMMSLIYGNRKLAERISSRRSLSSLEQWASLSLGNKKLTRMCRTKSTELTKYQAVNLLHQNSVEFRIFAGTLRNTSLLRYFEFLVSLYEYTHDASIKECNDDDYCKWVVSEKQADRYPHMVKFAIDYIRRPEARPKLKTAKKMFEAEPPVFDINDVDELRRRLNAAQRAARDPRVTPRNPAERW